MDQRAGHRRDIDGVCRDRPDEGDEAVRGNVQRCRRSIRQEVVRERGERPDAGAATHDHQPAARGDPAAHRDELIRGQLVAVHVLPDQPVQHAPALGTSGQVRDGQGHDRRRHAERIRRELEAADDRRRSLGEHAHHELVRIMDEVGDGHAVDELFVRDELHLHVPAEGRWLRVQHIRLVRTRREVHRHRVANGALCAALHPQLAIDRGTVVLEVHLDRCPTACARVALEHDPGVHRQRARGSAAKREWPKRHDEHGEEAREANDG